MKRSSSKPSAARYFQLPFESTADLYLVLAPDWTIVAVNDAYTRATMTRRQDIVGRALFDALPRQPNHPDADAMQSLRASLERVARERVPDAMAAQKHAMRRPDSEGGGFQERYWTWVNSPVFNARGELLYIIHRAEDVTEFMRLKQSGSGGRPGAVELHNTAGATEAEIPARAREAQQPNRKREPAAENAARRYRRDKERNRLIEQANRLKSEFLANMSHELRTPLNGIIGFAELMVDEKVGPLSRDHKEYLGDILTSGRHLLQLINDLVDLSNIDAGKLDFARERCDPAVAVSEVCGIVQAMAAKKRIRIKTECDAALNALETDARSLKRILYNYISNAVKFTPVEGSVSVRVAAQDDRFFRVEVQDSGPGIRRKDLKRLFVEFQRAENGGNQPQEGSGLGLALTKKIVEAQGGRVSVRSAPGKGSTFEAVLPRALTVRPRPAPLAPKRLPAAHAGARVVLVIEDDPDDRAWIAGALQSAGYAVETAATGAEALARCGEQQFSAITLDILLPDMSGLAVLKKLRAGGLNQRTPVTVITLLAREGILAGFPVNDILSKPVARDQLLLALERCGVSPHSNRPILVVDDDASALKVADDTLSRLGFRTLCHQDAAGALRAASKEPPAAVILDLIMPEMSGFEFLKSFRRRRPGRATPVIVWTSKDLTAADRADLRSVSGVARKDEQADELVQQIRNLLRLPQETFDREL